MADTGTTAIEAEQAEPPAATVDSATSVDTAKTAPQVAAATEPQSEAREATNTAPQTVTETAASAPMADTGTTAIEAEQAESPAQAAVIAPANKTASAFGYKPNPCIAFWDWQRAATIREALDNLAKGRDLKEQINQLLQQTTLPRATRKSLLELDRQPFAYDLQAPFITLQSYEAFTVAGFSKLHGDALKVYERAPDPQQCNPDYYAQKSDLELFALASALVDVTRLKESSVYCGSQERALPHKDEVAACLQAFNWRINDLLEDHPVFLLCLVDYFKLEEVKLPHVIYQFFGVDKSASLFASQPASSPASQPVRTPHLRSKLLERIGLPRRLDSKLLEQKLGNFAQKQNSNELANNHGARLHDLQQNFPEQYAQISAHNADTAKAAEQNVAAHHSAAPVENISQLEARLSPYWQQGSCLDEAWHKVIKVWRDVSQVWRKEDGIAAVKHASAVKSQSNFGKTADLFSASAVGLNANKHECGNDKSLQDFTFQHELDSLLQLSASCEQARQHAGLGGYSKAVETSQVKEQLSAPQSSASQPSASQSSAPLTFDAALVRDVMAEMSSLLGLSREQILLPVTQFSDRIVAYNQIYGYLRQRSGCMGGWLQRVPLALYYYAAMADGVNIAPEILDEALTNDRMAKRSLASLPLQCLQKSQEHAQLQPQTRPQLHPQAQHGFYTPDGAYIQEPPLDFTTPLPDKDAGQSRRMTAQEEFVAYSHHYEPPRKTEAHLRKCRDLSVVTAQRQAREMNIKSPPADFHDDDPYVYGSTYRENYAQPYQVNEPQEQELQQQCAPMQQTAAHYEQQVPTKMAVEVEAAVVASPSLSQGSSSQAQATPQQYASRQQQTGQQPSVVQQQTVQQYGQQMAAPAATPVNGVAQSAIAQKSSAEESCEYLPPQNALVAVGQGYAPQAQKPYPAAPSSPVTVQRTVCQLSKPILHVHLSSLSFQQGKYMSVDYVAQEFGSDVAAMNAFCFDAADPCFWQKCHVLGRSEEFFMYKHKDETDLQQATSQHQGQFNRSAGSMPDGVTVKCKRLPLDPNMTLDTFQLELDPTHANTKVREILRQFAHSGWDGYHIVCLSGDSGCGKTHLVQGFIHDLNRYQPAKKVLYISAQGFSQYFRAISCEKSKANNKGYFDAQSLCRELFAAYDVVVVEDIHTFKIGNKAPQIFMELITDLERDPNKLLLLTSKIPVDQLQGSSFAEIELLRSGLVEELKPISLQARISFLSNCLQLMGYDNLTADMVQYICACIGSSMYEVKGVLTKISTHLRTQDVVTREHLDSLIEAYRTDKQRKPKIEDVQRAVAKYFLVGVDELLSSDRTKAISWARTMAMRIVRDGLQVPYRKIADAFHKDPKSVREAMARTSNSFVKDASTLQVYLSLMADLGLRVPSEVLLAKS